MKNTEFHVTYKGRVISHIENEGEMAHALIHALEKRGWRMAAAESCSGGRIAQKITAVPGASAVFCGSMVSYTEKTKQIALGVSESTLKTYGVVSEETAREMATGALRLTEADVAVSVTGIAGPGGGTEACPVGTVCFGLACREEGVIRSVRVQFDPKRTREEICSMAASYAMGMVLSAANPTGM